MKMLKRYVIRLSNEFNSFRLPEFQSLASLFNLNYSFIEEPSLKPFFLLETNEEEKLLKIFHRSVLTHSLFEYWASGDCYESFYSDLKTCKQLYDERYQNCSFKINVESFGKKLSLKTKIEKIDKLDFLPFNGSINLNDPELTLFYLEYYGNDQNVIPESPLQIIIGKWIADNDRKYIDDFNLKKRKFIANTTMHPHLSFLISNIAKVNTNHIIYDPFVGSGSLLVSAAYHGAYVCGADIDFLLLHGLAKPSRCGHKKRDSDESVLANLKQYNLQSRYIDVLIADSSLPLVRDNVQFDAIITDPPYGMRESRERVGTNKEYDIPKELLEQHIPSKLNYSIDDIYNDLLILAQKHLCLNGRILFWVPYSKPDDKNVRNKFYKSNENTVQFEEIEKRFAFPSLKLISFSEQKLTKKYSRILIVMEKCAH